MIAESKSKLSTTEYIILGLLSTGPQTGYAIIQTFKNTTSGWNVSASSIYPALARLEAQSLIEGVLEAAHVMRPRRVYSILSAGEVQLDAWLTRAFTPEELLNNREIPLVKFLFAEQRLTRDEVLKWLDAYDAAIATYCDAHHFWHNAQLSVSSVHQRLLLEASMMNLEVQQRWIRMARQRLSSQVEPAVAG